MQFDLSRFRDTFFQEADEHLAGMESGLLGLDGAADPADLLNDIFRGAHSIKGAAGTFGFDRITGFTHSMESLLDRMREGVLSPSRERVDILLRAVDILRGLVTAARRGGPAPEETETVRTLLIAAHRAGEPQPGRPVRVRNADRSEGARLWHIRFQPSPDLFRQGMDPVLVLRELGRLGRIVETRLNTSRLPGLHNLDPETCYLGWSVRLETAKPAQEIRDVFAFVEDGAEIEIEAAEEARSKAEQAPLPAAQSIAARAPIRDSIRVATGKIDKLVDLVGELVIAQSMASTVLRDFVPARLSRLQEAFSEMERHTRELQERVMSVRMLPVGTVFSRFPRLVRDLAAATGKQIRLETTGEETELDKGVVEQLSDPLTHLIRNAADHGVETPADRTAQGKPEQATIRLHAFHQSGSVVVEISDDGRGLDTARIRRKGVERGLVAAGGELSEREIHGLIFEPGFSTADQVSGLSGRGVGMDVVKRNVESLNGTVEVESEPGRGTRVRIKLPLTLAILDGLLVRVGGETYVLPLVSILESIRPREGEVRVIAGRGEVVVVRKEPLPLARLHRLFGVSSGVTDPRRALVVIAEHQGKRLALLVDEIAGQQQVVVKSLETHFRKVDGVAGATILGDGRAALILDVAGLVQMARGTDGEHTEAA